MLDYNISLGIKIIFFKLTLHLTFPSETSRVPTAHGEATTGARMLHYLQEAAKETAFNTSMLQSHQFLGLFRHL